MASEPVRSTSIEAAPKDYSIPNAQQIRLLSVTASFTDNGAAGDWLPAVVILDNNGNALVRAVDQGVKVTAGSAAEVSWFPGVKNGAAAAPAGAQAAYAILSLSVANFGDTGFAVPTNTATDIRFPHQDATSSVPFALKPSTTYSDTIVLRSDSYVYVLHSSIRWHLAGFDQYSSIIGPSPTLLGSHLFGALDNHGETPAEQFSAGDGFSGSPLWGVDTKTFVVDTPPASVTLQAFQTSGSDKVLDEANLLCIAYTF